VSKINSIAAREDTELEARMWQRVNNGDHIAIFSCGGCFHFALFLNKELGLKLRGIRHVKEQEQLSHVWALSDTGGEGIDVHGVHAEVITCAIAENSEHPPKAEDIDVEIVEAAASKKNFSPELAAKLNEIARNIFYSHERFEKVRPLSSEKKAEIAAFCKNMEASLS